MIDEITALVENYRDWLHGQTTIKVIDDFTEITTPFLDRHNDCLQIYAHKVNGGYILCDDGYIIDDLTISGCGLDTQKRKDLLNMTLAGFGVTNGKDGLTIKATEKNFALKIHNLIQAMLAVNDLFYLAQPYVTSIFLDDVTAWFEQNGIRFISNTKFTGKSGYDHMFNFAVPKTPSNPERLVRAINNPTKDAAQAMAFAWVDTREVRAPDSLAFAILNDSEKPVPASVKDALTQYEVSPVLWSSRQESLADLAA